MISPSLLCVSEMQTTRIVLGLGGSLTFARSVFKKSQVTHIKKSRRTLEMYLLEFGAALRVISASFLPKACGVVGECVRMHICIIAEFHRRVVLTGISFGKCCLSESRDDIVGSHSVECAMT